MEGRLHHISIGVHASVYAYRPSPAHSGASLVGSSEDHTEGITNGVNTSRGTNDGLRVVKIVHAGPSGKRPGLKPHDVLKEVEILRSIEHPNIIPLLAYTNVPERMEHRLELPLLAFTVRDLLSPPLSSDSPLLDPPPADIDAEAWTEIFRGVAYQLFQALAHLHSRDIAHRDVKPENIIFTWTGILQLIDFGTAWGPTIPTPDAIAHGRALEDMKGGCAPSTSLAPAEDGEEWIEDEEDMVCAVGTCSYRAPELLFSPTQYDARALDMWATGCVLAEFWIPSAPRSGVESASSAGSDEDVDDDEDNDEEDPLDGPERAGDGAARHLFDATYGELGLAASIFRIRGSPTDTSWPAFKALPDAGKIDFNPSLGSPLDKILTGLRDSPCSLEIILMIEGLLQLDPARRLSANAALEEAVFTSPLSLPSTYALVPPSGRGETPLEKLLEPWLESARDQYRHI